MAVMGSHESIKSFDEWYENAELDPRDGSYYGVTVGDCGSHLWRLYNDSKREMDARVGNYEVLEKLADGEVVTKKSDLPNVSSGETAGLVRRISRNLVQNCPNVEVISKFDDDSVQGIFARHILTTKIIGSDEYSNDMQQNLFSSTKTAFTLGFQTVIPCLLQDAGGGWFMKYDAIHYRDVFPEPGCKDIRQATFVFIRRYLTRGEALRLIKDEAAGWDIAALKTMVKQNPPSREQQSVPKQTKKHHQIPDGYPIITWYSDCGGDFLTFSENDKMLLRMEKNKHPLKQHPVHFLVLEKDDQQPLGKSQVELLIGRQEFQDLMLNGAMKLWYRNINPTILGYGVGNSVPNMSPGKYTQISNPNAKVEAFEVNTGTLMQYGQISQQNLGSMVNLIGAADQQMAQSQGVNGQGMSATPQGVDAQTAMVDITTNNYQKAIESFFSHYCSYALTIYFQELKSVKGVTPTAEARMRLVAAGLKVEEVLKDGSLDIDFAEMCEEYWVLCVPGSLTELEDEKQLRILQQIYVPLSQAMPALAAAQDPDALRNASIAMQYIVQKTIELSGSSYGRDLKNLLTGRDNGEIAQREDKVDNIERMLTETSAEREAEMDVHTEAITGMQGQIQQLTEATNLILQKLGVTNAEPSTTTPELPQEQVDQGATEPTVALASA